MLRTRGLGWLRCPRGHPSCPFPAISLLPCAPWGRRVPGWGPMPQAQRRLTRQVLAKVRGPGRAPTSLPQRRPTPALVMVMVMVMRTPPARVMAKAKGFRPTQVRALGKQRVRRPVKRPGRWWSLALT